MDPKKMQAFVAGAGKAKEMHEEPEPEEELESEEEIVEDEDQESTAKFDAIIPLLEEHASAIEDAAAMVEAEPEDVLAAKEAPDNELVVQALTGFDGLDDELKEAMADSMAGATADDCAVLAKHLEDEGMIEDTDAVEAWFCLISKGLADLASTEEAPEEEAPEEEAPEEEMPEGEESEVTA